MTARCCCGWGAAVKGEIPEFNCIWCGVHGNIFGDDPSRDNACRRHWRMYEDKNSRVNVLARLMMQAWEVAEGEKVNPSYVATFADMARAVVKHERGETLHEVAEALRDAANALDDHTNCDCEDAARGSHFTYTVDSQWLRDRADTLDRAGGKNAGM